MASMDIRQISRQFIREFLEIYKAQECLWNVKSEYYSNRLMKEKGYSVLIEKMKEVDENADREMVVRKIDSLRGSFRKELKKKENWKKTGVEYQPSLWYFDHMAFLLGNVATYTKKQRTSFDGFKEEASEDADESTEDDQASPSPGSDPKPPPLIYFSSKEIKEETHSEDEVAPKVAAKEEEEEDDEEEEEVVVPAEAPFECVQPAQIFLPTHQPPVRVSRPKKRKRVAEEKTQENHRPKRRDDFAVMAENYANKMRKLSEDRVAIVDKLITDLLFEAHCGNVSTSTRIVLTEVRKLIPLRPNNAS